MAARVPAGVRNLLFAQIASQMGDAAFGVLLLFGTIAVLAALCGPAAWLSREFRSA